MITKTKVIRYNLKPEQSADTVKEGIVTGSVVSLSLHQDFPENLEEMITHLGSENKVFSIALRQLEVDFGNNERAKLQTVNGHSTKVVLTEAEKESKKAERAENKALVNLLKSKGLTLADIENM